MRKFQVMMVGTDGTLCALVPVAQTIFDNVYDAEALAYELSKATGDNYTVSQFRKGKERKHGNNPESAKSA